MSLWRQINRGVRVLVRRTAADQELADEVRLYLEEATAAHVARGLSEDEARRAALIECGTLTSAREEVRSHGWENLVATSLADLRYAARQLLHKSRGTTALAVLILGLAVGATSAIFSAVKPALL